MAYQIELSPVAERQLGRLGPGLRARIAARIDALAVDPRPPGVQKLTESQDEYRIRIGDYRVVYDVRDQVLLVLVVRVARRRDVYR